MPLMPQHDPLPDTYRRDNRLIWRDIKALWKAIQGVKTPLSTDIPRPVGVEGDPGGSEEASRSDHVHQGATEANQVFFAYDYLTVP